MKLSDAFSKAKGFEKDAHKILGVQEASQYRVINLENSYKDLQLLSLKQDDLFRQALTCVERECFRAAHVMAWAGFMDFIEEKIFEDGGEKIKSVRTKWHLNSVESLREEINEYQIIQSLQEINLCVKSETKALLGLLNKRNECAHPTNYFPGLNDTLGYISELILRVKSLKGKR